MKNKLLTLLIVVLATFSVFSLVSCGKESHDAHAYKRVREACDATCTEDGWYQVDKCIECDVYRVIKPFSDIICHDEMKALELARISAGHNIVHREKRQPSSCTEDGYISHFECDRCHALFTDPEGKGSMTEDEIRISAEHDFIFREGLYPTCNKEGRLDYWECGSCHKYFDADDITTEITEEDVVIPKTSHDLIHREAHSATCTEFGNIEYWYCQNSRCYKRFYDADGKREIEDFHDAEIAPLDHDCKPSVLVSATCGRDEVKRYSCQRDNCDYYYDETTEDSALTHEFESGVCKHCKYPESALGLNIHTWYDYNDQFGGITYAEIGGFGNSNIKGEFTIPNTYKGYPVKKVYLDFEGISEITKIIVPENVEVLEFSIWFDYYNTSVKEIVIESDKISIEIEDFRGLEKITFKKSSYKISSLNLKGCSSLKEVYLPSSLTVLSDNAFKGCTSLEKVIVDDEIDFIAIDFKDEYSNPLRYAHRLYKRIGTDIIAIKNYVLDSSILDDSLTSIPDYLFYGWEDLVEVELPSSVKSIGKAAFKDCVNLTTLRIRRDFEIGSQYSFDTIGESAFEGCKKLNTIYMPTMTSISKNAFCDCENVTSIYFVDQHYNKDKSILDINTWAAIKFENLYSNPMYAGKATFYWWLRNEGSFGNLEGLYKELEYVNFAPSKGEDDEFIQPIIVPQYAYAGLQAYIVGGTVYFKEIGNGAFYNASGVGLNRNGDHTLKLYSSSIADAPKGYKGCEKIGKQAFYGCKNLHKVVLRDISNATPSIIIGDEAFAYSGLTEFTLENDAGVQFGKEILKGCESIESLKLITLKKSNGKDGGLSYFFSSNIPESLKVIDLTNLKDGQLVANDLAGVKGLEKLYISGNLTIKENAFGTDGNATTDFAVYYDGTISDYSKNVKVYNKVFENVCLYVRKSTDSDTYELVTSLTLDDEVNYDAKFAGITSLNKIIVPSGYNRLSDLDNNAFLGCENLLEIYNLSGRTLTCGSINYGYIAKYALKIYLIEDTVSDLVEKDGCYFVLDDTDGEAALTLAKYVGDGGEVVLPDSVELNGATYNDYAIGQNAFAENDKITKITTPDGVVTSIGAKAFFKCVNLKSATFGEGLLSIGDNAFAYSGIRSFVIPDSVTSLGKHVFQWCYNLWSLTLGKNAEFDYSGANNIIYGCRLFEFVDRSGKVNYVGETWYTYAFTISKNESKATIEGDYAFIVKNSKNYLGKYLGDEKEITLPSVSGGYAIAPYFAYYAEIESVTIPDCVTDIGEFAFFHSNLTKVDLGNGVKSIGEYAFGGSSSSNVALLIEEIVLPASIESIDWGAFEDSRVKTLVLAEGFDPSKLFGYPDSATLSFRSIQQVKAASIDQVINGRISGGGYFKIIIDGNVVTQLEINDENCKGGKFYGLYCDGLEKVVFDGIDEIVKGVTANEVVIRNVKKIHDNSGFYSVTKLSLDGVEYIGYNAFDYESINCTVDGGLIYVGSVENPYYALVGIESEGIKTITLNGGTVLIASQALDGIGDVSVTLNDGLKYIGSSALSCSGLKEIVIPSSVIIIYEDAFCNSLLEKIEFGEDSKLQIIEKNAFYINETIDNLVIPNSVKRICESAFNKVNTLTLGSGLEYIESKAFSSVESIKVEKIGDYAKIDFAYRDAVIKNSEGQNAAIYVGGKELTEEVVLDDDDKKIGDYAFYGFDITSLVGRGVESIGDCAFEMSELQKITLGNALKSVGEYVLTAYYNNNSKFNELIYEGSINDWAKTSIGKNNSNFVIKLKIEGNAVSGAIELDVDKVGDFVFCGNEGITSVTLSDNVKEIGVEAFGMCTKLSNINLSNVEIIGDDAFSYTKIENIDLSSIVEIGSMAFASSYERRHTGGLITIGAGLKTLYTDSFYRNANNHYTLNFKFDPEYLNKVEVKRGASDSLIMWYGFGIKFNEKNIDELEINDKAIQDYAFGGIDFTTVKLGDEVESVGAYAFANVKNLYLTDTVKTIDRSAFNSKKLQSVYYSGTLEQWNALLEENGAFVGEDTKVYVDYGKELTPEGPLIVK